MIRQKSNRQSGLSYISASRYADRMMDFRGSRPVETAFTKGHTLRRNGMTRPAFFCGIQPKVTENKNLLSCKPDRTQ